MARALRVIQNRDPHFFTIDFARIVAPLGGLAPELLLARQAFGIGDAAGARYPFLRAAAAHEGLRTVDIGGSHPGFPRKLDAAVVVADPVDGVGVEVEVLRVVVLPRPGHPFRQRTVAEFERSREIACVSPLAVALALEREGRWH